MDTETLSRFMSNVDMSGECWIWTGSKNPAGYGMTRLGGSGKRGSHRIMYMIFNGMIGSKDHVMHACDNPSCVKPTHLSIGTASDNMSDMAVKARGNTVKLTIEQVKYIRNVYTPGRKVGDGASGVLAKKFGVDRHTIRDVAVSKTWRLA